MRPASLLPLGVQTAILNLPSIENFILIKKNSNSQFAKINPREMLVFGSGEN